MKTFPRIFWGLALLALLSAALFQAFPWLKYNMRDARYLWLKEKLYYDTRKDIFALYVGSSHIWNAVDTPLINQRHPEQYSLNAGVNWMGEDAKLIIARDFLRQKRVRNLIFEIHTSSDLHSHKYFPFLATATDAIGFTLGQTARVRRDGHLKSALELVVGAWVPQAVKGFYALGREAWGARYQSSKPELDGHLSIDRVYSFAPEDIATRIVRGVDEEPVVLSYALLELASLCRKNGVQLHFLFVPDHNAPLPGPAYMSSLEPYGKVIVLDPAQYYLAPLWYDTGHLNVQGSKIFTELLLKSELYSGQPG